MTPAAAVRIACARIRAKKNPERARFTANYFIAYTPIPLLGLTVPEQRTIARELFTRVKSEWSVDHAFEFADRMIARRNFEDRAVGIYLLGCYKKQLPSSLLKRIKPWLTDNKLCSWAFVDALCGEVTHPIIAADRGLLRVIQPWARARNMWVRRTSAVSFVRLATRGEELGMAYEVAETLIGDTEDLIHKAQGWLLREAGKTDMARLERFLVRHGPRMSRTAVRYAIEKYPAGKRKRLLAATRG